MDIALLWILCSALVGMYGAHKKTWGKFGGAFIISLIFSPLIGLIVVGFSNTDEREFAQEGLKKCPYCAEWIKKDATVCRYCRRKLREEEDDSVE